MWPSDGLEHPLETDCQRRATMHAQLRNLLVSFLLIFTCAQAFADSTADTVKVFREAGQSGALFDKCYGYAVFPTIGKGGIGIGGAHGKGKVFAGGKYVGDTAMTQLTIGLQLGGQAYSEIIFFEDKRAFDAFTSGKRVPRRKRARRERLRARAPRRKKLLPPPATRTVWRFSRSQRAASCMKPALAAKSSAIPRRNKP
jgi:hypothetical protein